MLEIILILEKISPLSEESKQALRSVLRVYYFEKNEFLLKKGEVATCFYYLKKGVTRIFYHKKEKEITEWLALSGEFFLSIASFYKQKPSSLNIQAIEFSEVIVIPHDDFLQLSKKFHDIETLHRTMLMQSLLLSQERMESIQFENAQERYERLIQNRPEIVKRVSLTYIASFLGITLETLSRIRVKK
jgi:CRP-like cAMP-binding protein